MRELDGITHLWSWAHAGWWDSGSSELQEGAQVLLSGIREGKEGLLHELSRAEWTCEP